MPTFSLVPLEEAMKPRRAAVQAARRKGARKRRGGKPERKPVARFTVPQA